VTPRPLSARLYGSECWHHLYARAHLLRRPVPRDRMISAQRTSSGMSVARPRWYQSINQST